MTDLPRVDFDELDFDEHQRMIWRGQPFTGIAVEFSTDGKLLGEVPHVDGLEHGLSRIWHRTGHLKTETNLWKGVVHGFRREWDEQGHLISEMIGEYGIKVMEKAWDEQGNLIKDWLIGPADDMYSILLLSRETYGREVSPVEAPFSRNQDGE